MFPAPLPGRPSSALSSNSRPDSIGEGWSFGWVWWLLKDLSAHFIITFLIALGVPTVPTKEICFGQAARAPMPAHAVIAPILDLLIRVIIY